MRKPRLSSALIGLVIAAAAPVYADGSIAGVYEAKFEQVANNCEHPIAYAPQGVVKIDIKGNEIQVDIERTPLMMGSLRSKDRKVIAKSRVGHTKIEGMDGVFSIAGRVTAEGMLALTLVGEYQVGGKPLCTQSWNLSGLVVKPDAGSTSEKSKPKH